MDSHLKKRVLDKAGRDSILSCTAGFLTSRHPEILAAYVFGSFAREEVFGDLDVAFFWMGRRQRPLSLN